MLPYPHFSVPNLYLENGYEAQMTPDGEIRMYSAEDRLEHCVRRVLLRRPTRLRGWDLRFLRRGLDLSQGQFGKMIERDAQTVARWEKSKRHVPALADLAIRSRFAEKFEPSMPVKELLGHVDGKSPKLPNFILLTFNGSDWSFSFRPLFSLLRKEATTQADLILPRGPGATQLVYVSSAKALDVWEKAAAVERTRRPSVALWKPFASDLYGLQLGATPMLQFKASVPPNDLENETKH